MPDMSGRFIGPGLCGLLRGSDRLRGRGLYPPRFLPLRPLWFLPLRTLGVHLLRLLPLGVLSLALTVWGPPVLPAPAVRSLSEAL